MISIIVAYDEERLIGKDGELPWHFKEDMAYFKKITENHICVMGRKTYQSILRKLQKPLPNRTNIVVSKTLNDDRVVIIDDLEPYLASIKETSEEVFIIGGSKIYEAALPYADKLYITHIHGTYQGDTYFPVVDFSKYIRIYFDAKEELSFAIYERRE